MSHYSRTRRFTCARLGILLVTWARLGSAIFLLVACAWLGSAHAQDARPTLYVFLQLDVKPNILQQMLQKQVPGIAVTVFGRFRDFQDVVASRQPDAILAIPPLLDLDHTKPTLQGVRGGREWEEYVLVFSGSNQPASLSGKTIGVVDLLGHDGTQSFATSLLKTPDIKVKRVAKVEDLLALLEFSAADAILIPGAVVKRLTERTRLPLAVRELPGAHVGLPAAAVLRPANRDPILRSLRALDAETMSILGIDNWSAR